MPVYVLIVFSQRSLDHVLIDLNFPIRHALIACSEPDDEPLYQSVVVQLPSSLNTNAVTNEGHGRLNKPEKGGDLAVRPMTHQRIKKRFLSESFTKYPESTEAVPPNFPRPIGKPLAPSFDEI